MRVDVEFCSQKVFVIPSVTARKDCTKFVTLKKIFYCVVYVKLIHDVEFIFVCQSVWSPESS
jgi:hypothetical protein